MLHRKKRDGTELRPFVFYRVNSKNGNEKTITFLIGVCSDTNIHFRNMAPFRGDFFFKLRDTKAEHLCDHKQFFNLYRVNRRI